MNAIEHLRHPGLAPHRHHQLLDPWRTVLGVQGVLHLIGAAPTPQQGAHRAQRSALMHGLRRPLILVSHAGMHKLHGVLHQRLGVHGPVGRQQERAAPDAVGMELGAHGMVEAEQAALAQLVRHGPNRGVIDRALPLHQPAVLANNVCELRHAGLLTQQSHQNQQLLQPLLVSRREACGLCVCWPFNFRLNARPHLLDEGGFVLARWIVLLHNAFLKTDGDCRGCPGRL